MVGERVLLVDDEEDFVATLKKRLEVRKLRVTTACDGPTALEAVRQQSFDAIILDLKMPGMDGIETLQQIMALDQDAQVILLTGHGSVQSGVDAMKHGAVDFLLKPAEFPELLSRIDEAGRKRMTLLEKRSSEKIDEILHKQGW